MATSSMLFPMPFKRQFPGPLDVDEVFVSRDEMDVFKNDPIAYPGMKATCLEDLTTIFILNLNKSEWIPVGGSSVDLFINDEKIEKIDNAYKIKLPTKVSELENDEKFVTKDDNKLVSLGDIEELAEDAEPTNKSVPMWISELKKFMFKTIDNDKVKYTSSDEEAKYLSDLLNGTYFELKDDKIIVKTLKDMVATITEINYLSGLDKNIMEKFEAIGTAQTKAYTDKSFATYAELESFDFATLDEDYTWVMYVIADEHQTDPGANGKGTAYLCTNATKIGEKDPVYIGVTETRQRVLTIDKVDLTSEVTNILPKENLPEDVVYNESLEKYMKEEEFVGEDATKNVQTAATIKSYTETETSDAINTGKELKDNVDILKEITNEKDAGLFLNGKGVYDKAYYVGAIEPESKNVLWIDDSQKDKKKYILKYFSTATREWIMVASGTVSGGSETIEWSSLIGKPFDMLDESIFNIITDVGGNKYLSIRPNKYLEIDEYVDPYNIGTGSVKHSDSTAKVDGIDTANPLSIYAVSRYGERGWIPFPITAKDIVNNKLMLDNVALGQIYSVDLARRDDTCSSLVQAYEFINDEESTKNINGTLDYFSNQHNYLCNHEHVEIHNGCDLKKNHEVEGELYTDGCYEFKIDKSEFIKIFSISKKEV